MNPAYNSFANITGFFFHLRCNFYKNRLLLIKSLTNVYQKPEYPSNKPDN